MRKRFISLLLMLIWMTSSFVCLTVNAAGSEAITKRTVPTYLYDMDHQIGLECLFTSELPEVAYIDAEDYLDHLYSVDAVETKNPDGTFTVSNKNGAMVIDPSADTISYENFEKLIKNDTNVEGSVFDSAFAQPLPLEQTGEIHPVTLDLAAYGIDIIECDGRVYLPVPTLNDIHLITYNSAEYLNGNLYFTHSTEFMQGGSYYDRSSLFDQLERTPAMADFTYREMCFLMDHFYGAPSKAVVASGITEKGFDKTLDDYSDDTRSVKGLLQSTDKRDYFVGLCILSSVFDDGGHTALFYEFTVSSAQYPDSAFAQYAIKVFSSSETAEEQKALLSVAGTTLKQLSKEYPKKDKEPVLQQYEVVKEWADNVAKLYAHGDTVLFSFDSFKDEVVEPFKWSLDYAQEHGFKNFVIDLSTNGGGSDSVLKYMMAIVTNKKNRTNKSYVASIDTLTSNTHREGDLLDLNLDGVFDENDKDVVYDFNFAVLTTSASFSCGNLMPVMCKDNGVCLIGETSGGGSCLLTVPVTPENHFFALSGQFKLISANGGDVDAGAPVDYHPEGTKIDTESMPMPFERYDYGTMFDLDLISALVKEFYYQGELLLGDANLDGEADITDATTVQRYDVKLTHLSDTALTTADVDRDGEVTVIDATWLQRYDAKMKAPEGIGKPIENQ